MDLTITDSRWITVVAVTGDLDAEASGRMKQALDGLLDRGKTRLVVDLGGVGYVDSAGLGELVRAMKRAREAAGDVRVCALSGHVRRIFEMTRLDEGMAVYATREEALAAWGQA